MKKIFVKNYGCQMNVYDTNKLLAIMSDKYEQTNTVQDADLVVLNTCHVREKAVMKLYSDLGRINQIKEKLGKNMLIAVIGCVAQIQGKHLMSRFPYVNFVLGTTAIQNLPSMIEALESAQKFDPCDQSSCPNEKFDKFRDYFSSYNFSYNCVSAYLTIQEGCDNFCTYCSVPASRGREVSRKFSDIVDEARYLALHGVKEIVLLGQNVNSYHYAENGSTYRLSDVLYALDEIKDLKRLVYISPNPQNMKDDLISAHKNIKKLIPYLHLPVQSGSNRILKAMNRPYTREEYFEIIAKLKEARPDIVFSTDIIVGFPGETEEDFEETLDVVNKVNFVSSFYFKYSKRPATIAANMQNQIPEQVKDERFARLHALVQKQKLEFNKKTIGSIQNVLFESVGKYEDHITGKTEYFQNVFVKNTNLNLIGTERKVKIISVNASNMEGEIVDQ